MKTVRLFTVSMLFVASALMAEALPPKGPLAFETYDKNSNGLVSAQEFNEIQTQRMLQKAQSGKMMKNAKTPATFVSIDLNNDGAITQQELTAHQQTQMNQKMNQKNSKMKNRGMGRFQ